MREIHLEEQRASTARPIWPVLVGIIALGFAFVSGVLLGLRLGDSGGPIAALLPPLGPSQVPDEDADLDSFWEAWALVEDNFYYELPDEQERIEGAIDGMVRSLDDPFSAYVDPEIASILREDDTGAFEGIGAYVETAPEGGVFIIRVFEDGPAAEAGMRAGDIIITADGQDVTQIALNEALLLIRGPAGSQVTLEVFREGENELLEFDVRRRRIEVPVLESEMLEDNIGYVALFEFNQIASSRLRSAVRDLIDDGAEGIILDLRGNPGGFLDESIAVADLFLPEGVVLIQRDVEGGYREYTSDNGDLAENIPLVVLINGGSASASEIVAGAIKDRDRGTLIGQTTFGKGSVQLQYDLSDGGQLRITYANWYTPDDISITEVGITPDISVGAGEDGLLGEDDPQLDAAIRHLQTEIGDQ